MQQILFLENWKKLKLIFLFHFEDPSLASVYLSLLWPHNCKSLSPFMSCFYFYPHFIRLFIPLFACLHVLRFLQQFNLKVFWWKPNWKSTRTTTTPTNHTQYWKILNSYQFIDNFWQLFICKHMYKTNCSINVFGNRGAIDYEAKIDKSL